MFKQIACRRKGNEKRSIVDLAIRDISGNFIFLSFFFHRPEEEEVRHIFYEFYYVGIVC